tara:strand:+ start:229 stop:711 length:483 start_codon:yes stop_codon:yes gene_type:complete
MENFIEFQNQVEKLKEEKSNYTYILRQLEEQEHELFVQHATKAQLKYFATHQKYPPYATLQVKSSFQWTLKHIAVLLSAQTGRKNSLTEALRYLINVGTAKLEEENIEKIKSLYEKWNAIMANAYSGNESKIMEEIEKICSLYDWDVQTVIDQVSKNEEF